MKMDNNHTVGPVVGVSVLSALIEKWETHAAKISNDWYNDASAFIDCADDLRVLIESANELQMLIDSGVCVLTQKKPKGPQGE